MTRLFACVPLCAKRWSVARCCERLPHRAERTAWRAARRAQTVPRRRARHCARAPSGRPSRARLRERDWLLRAQSFATRRRIGRTRRAGGAQPRSRLRRTFDRGRRAGSVPACAPCSQLPAAQHCAIPTWFASMCLDSAAAPLLYPQSQARARRQPVSRSSREARRARAAVARAAQWRSCPSRRARQSLRARA